MMIQPNLNLSKLQCPKLQFKGISRYTGETSAIKRRISEKYNETNCNNEIAIREGEGIVLTGNDTVKFMKDKFNITITPDILAFKNEHEISEAMENGSPQVKKDIQALALWAIITAKEDVDAKVFEYAEERIAASSDCNGQPILNITV